MCPGLCSPGPPGSAALSPHEALIKKLLNKPFKVPIKGDLFHYRLKSEIKLFLCQT